MTITFSCPSCKARLEASDKMGGHVGLCPTCNWRLTVPERRKKWTRKKKRTRDND